MGQNQHNTIEQIIKQSQHYDSTMQTQHKTTQKPKFTQLIEGLGELKSSSEYLNTQMPSDY